MKKTIWFLYILAAVFVVRYEIGYPPYIDIHKYAMGQERSPFQQRALMVPIERWAIQSPWLEKVARLGEKPPVNCYTLTKWDEKTSILVKVLFICEDGERSRHSGLHDPANIPIVVVNFLSLILSAWCAVRLYRNIAPDGRLWFLIFPLLIYGELVTNLRGVYLYDMPSMALFSLGAVLIFEKRFTLFALVFTVACLNRETAIMLIPLLVLRGITLPIPKHRWHRWIPVAVLPVALVALWASVRECIKFALPGVGSELVFNLAPNLKSAINPLHWPNLLMTLGFLWIPIASGWRLTQDKRLKWFLWIYPLWLVPMMIRGVITENRIFGELLPLTVVVVVVIFEQWILDGAAQ